MGYNIVYDCFKDIKDRLFKIRHVISISDHANFGEVIEMVKRDAAHCLASMITNHQDQFIKCEEKMIGVSMMVRAEAVVLTVDELNDIVVKAFNKGVERGCYGRNIKVP